MERFAPGFRDLVLASSTRTAAEVQAHNPNYVGGDISAGAQDLRQTVARPVLRWNPYRIADRGPLPLLVLHAARPGRPRALWRARSAESRLRTCSGSARSPISAPAESPCAEARPGGEQRASHGAPGRSGPFLEPYHDEEWGVPVHDDRLHFEFLVLESAQAGLSWLTILKRREAYRRAFFGFDPVAVAELRAGDVERLLGDAGIIRNRRKIESTISNARAFLEVRKEFGTFDSYIWGFVDGSPLVNSFDEDSAIPAETALSKEVSGDLRRRGFWFPGPGRLLLAPAGNRARRGPPHELLSVEGARRARRRWRVGGLSWA